MNKKTIYGVVAVVLIIIVVLIFANRTTIQPASQVVLPEGFDDLSYTLDGKTVDLQNGSGSLEGRTVSLFGEEAEGDITEDGMPDIVMILKEERATTTAYHLVAAMQESGKYRATPGVLLGENMNGISLRSALGGVIVQYEREGSGSSASTSSTPSVRIAERFYVVVDGVLESLPLPE